MSQKDFGKIETQLNNFLEEKGLVLDESIDLEWMQEQFRLYEWGLEQYKTLFPDT